jgi:hypothetical protein
MRPTVDQQLVGDGIKQQARAGLLEIAFDLKPTWPSKPLSVAK